MKGWDKRRRQIKEELISGTGKRALLVEGPDDESLFRIFLSRKFGPDGHVPTDPGSPRGVRMRKPNQLSML